MRACARQNRTNPEDRDRTQVEPELTSQRHEREATAEEISAIEEAVVEKLRTTQSEAVRLLQSLSCDVMGFAGAVHRADPKVWAGIRG